MQMIADRLEDLVAVAEAVVLDKAVVAAVVVVISEEVEEVAVVALVAEEGEEEAASRPQVVAVPSRQRSLAELLTFRAAGSHFDHICR